MRRQKNQVSKELIHVEPLSAIRRRFAGTGGDAFARAITAGGLNSVVGSKHFNDQGVRYSSGDLREVYFYPTQLKGHTERVYKPGN